VGAKSAGRSPRGWERLLQLGSEIDVGLDGNGALKGIREGLGHFAIARASVNEDHVCRQLIHHACSQRLAFLFWSV